jgi:glutathione peroxidase
MGLTSFLANKLSGNKPSGQIVNSIYDLKIKGLDGKEIDFSKYRGKKLLIVNTASKCGKTPQYAGLEKLHEQFGDKVNVLGFPANNFLWQEPGSSEEIAAFCERNYGVKFQMFEKVSVKGGDQHPLYQWLESKTGNILSAKMALRSLFLIPVYNHWIRLLFPASSKSTSTLLKTFQRLFALFC